MKRNENNVIHFMALEGTKKRLEENEKEKERVLKELDEAIKLGDLSENSEYTSLKETMRVVMHEQEQLQPVLNMTPVKCPDTESTIQPGCIIHLKIYSVSKEQIPRDSPKVEELRKQPPELDGVFMYGGALPFHILTKDKIVSTSTCVGQFLQWKQPGYYSVKVPGGYANLEVEKLSVETTKVEDLRYELRH